MVKRCCMRRVPSWPSSARVPASSEATRGLLWPCSAGGASWNWLAARTSASSSISARRCARNSSSCGDSAAGGGPCQHPPTAWGRGPSRPPRSPPSARPGTGSASRRAPALSGPQSHKRPPRALGGVQRRECPSPTAPLGSLPPSQLQLCTQGTAGRGGRGDRGEWGCVGPLVAVLTLGASLQHRDLGPVTVTITPVNAIVLLQNRGHPVRGGTQ